MNIHKTKLAELESGYAVSPFVLSGTTHVVAAPSGKGPVLIFSPPEWKMRVLADGPGGAMSLSGIPGRNETLLAIMECYPVFRFEHGGIYLYRPNGEAGVEEHRTPPGRGSGQAQNRPMWKGRRILDMPFAHRLDVVDVGGTSYVVVATIAAGKANKEDWSRPGALYVMPVPEELEGEWKPVAVLEGIMKNHGLHRTRLDDREVFLVSGQQGLFALPIPDSPSSPWSSEKLLPHEVSEVYAADLDDDGQNELVTIEPFHGNTLSVYKRSGSRIDSSWHRLFEADLSYGHGIWAGKLGGEAAVMAGSRAGDKDLSVFTIQSLVPFVAQRSVVEPEAGPTQFIVLHEEEHDLIFSVNQAKSEVALYRVTN